MQIISEIKKNVNLFSQFPSFLVYALGYADCTGGADQAAQVAAYTFGSCYLGLAGVCIEADCLMTAVAAGYVAASAAYALFAVNLGIYQSVSAPAKKAPMAGWFICVMLGVILGMTGESVFLRI